MKGLTPSETAVLILAPLGRDALLASDALTLSGFHSEIIESMAALLERLSEPCGAVIIAEEALEAGGIAALTAWLEAQPAWSDLPIVMLTSGGRVTGASRLAFEAFLPHGNVTLLERPLRVITLRSAVQVAIRARKRQYQVRDLLLDGERAVVKIHEANQAKDQFLAALSHELRTPLTPVLMIVGALVQDPSLPKSLIAELETIQRNVELEARLIDDLLDLTRITRGKLLLRSEVVDLQLIVERALETCRSGEAALKRHHIVISHEVESVCTFGDPARIQQILWNLLNNATKFTPPGGLIEVKTFRVAPGRIGLSVKDNGIGIDPKVLPVLFEAFQQGDASITRRFGGLGMGLAICKALADLHGGSLKAMSEGPGKGATFLLELCAVPESLKPKALGSPVPISGPQRLLNILLVEDHDGTRAALSRLLTRSGHRVTQATTVGEALNLAACRNFDLLVSDLGLPDASGLELMQELDTRYQLPGIALSGFGMEEDVRACLEAGFQAHITKPVDWRRFQETLQNVALRSDRQIQALPSPLEPSIA